MSARAVSVIGAACLLAGWLLASGLLPPVARSQSSSEEQRPRLEPAQTPAEQPYIERLRVRLRKAPEAPTPRRNPFVFGQRTPAAPPSLPPEVRDSAAPPALPPGPDFELAGVASSDTADGPTRTAIISARSDVLLVKAGDTLPGGYTVVRVDDSAIVVADDSGRELVLHLK